MNFLLFKVHNEKNDSKKIESLKRFLKMIDKLQKMY